MLALANGELKLGALLSTVDSSQVDAWAGQRLGWSADYIFRTYSGMSNDYPHMEELAYKARVQAGWERIDQEGAQTGNK